MRDAGVVGEGRVESRALGFAQGSEIWVVDLVIGMVEIVIALCVADAVDGDFCHDGDWIRIAYCKVVGGVVRIVGSMRKYLSV